MGIPRLASRLRQAGLDTTKELGRTGEPAHGTKAILDAPSFVYYIFNVLQARRPPPHTLEPAVSYDECAREAVSWLERLEAFGFTIEVIYFDGALPLTKRAVREARMTAYVKRIQSLYNAWNQTIQKLRSGGGLITPSAWGDTALQQAKKRAPPPAFLVPAVLEALHRSKYSERTYVMPDEADKFCVMTARQLCKEHPAVGVAIFSNDSDLLVYNAGLQTKIIPFSELRFSTDKPAVISGVENWPSQFAAERKLPDLLKLAFWMSQYPTMSAVDAQKLTENQHIEKVCSFQAFRKEYEFDELHGKALETKDAQRDLHIGLDPRVSELVFQANDYVGLADLNYLRVYVPILLEDPGQKSAWNIGTDLREVAYTVLRYAASVPQEKVLIEFWRAGDHIKMHQCNLLDHNDLARLCSHYSDALDGRQDQCAELTDVETWRLLVMRLALDELQHTGCSLPSPGSVLHVLAGQKSANWRIIDLAAQYQAMYYSLRIVYQIFRYIFLSKANATNSRTAFNDDVYRIIRNELTHLPTISEFFEPSMETTTQCEVKFMPFLEAHLTKLDPQWRSRGDKLKKGKKRSRRTSERKDVRMRAMPSTSDVNVKDDDGVKLGSNPFAALSED